MMLKNKLIFNKYKVKRFLGLSDFCWAYQGVNLKNNEPVFLKFEKKNFQFNFLESEAYCLYNLKGFGIPKLLSYGKTGLYNVLIEELLGNSLWNLWKLKKKDKKSNLKNVCMVALQIINRLEYIHSKNYIHKDIKPQNFVNGRKDPHIIYIIDFGFSHKYRSSRTGKHIKYINKKVSIGSLSFISINANIGYEQSRRDDLESLGYMLIFFANDNLPWMNFEDLNINKTKKCLKIYNSKKTISVEKICKGLPEEFIQYINYTRKLEFEEDPNYDYLRK
jgi:serine/threonine protein kinase